LALLVIYYLRSFCVLGLKNTLNGRIMAIDWILAEKRPNKRQKIEGRFLLDLRAQINKLEHRIKDLRLELETLKDSQ